MMRRLKAFIVFRIEMLWHAITGWARRDTGQIPDNSIWDYHNRKRR